MMDDLESYKAASPRMRDGITSCSANWNDRWWDESVSLIDGAFVLMVVVLLRVFDSWFSLDYWQCEEIHYFARFCGGKRRAGGVSDLLVHRKREREKNTCQKTTAGGIWSGNDQTLETLFLDSLRESIPAEKPLMSLRKILKETLIIEANTLSVFEH